MIQLKIFDDRRLCQEQKKYKLQCKVKAIL